MSDVEIQAAAVLICHGNGDPANNGCCSINGYTCPNRLTQAGMNAFYAKYNLTTLQQQRAAVQMQGVTNGCAIPTVLIAKDQTLINNRAALNAQWDAHPDYVSACRTAWNKIEDANGLPRNSYQCSTWGPGGRPTGQAQCCFSETQATNDQRAAGLSANGLKVRKAGAG